MLRYFLLSFLFALVLSACSHKPQTMKAEGSQTGSVKVSVEEKTKFEEFVSPMLMRNCSPCHAPGGKMYERLPFDSADVVREHSVSIAGRLKSTEDKETLQQWIDKSGD